MSRQKSEQLFGWQILFSEGGAHLIGDKVLIETEGPDALDVEHDIITNVTVQGIHEAEESVGQESDGTV
eukprot:scaffold1065_cov406-Prasinococcus_capsulatus_cf.AAC.2